MAYCQNDDLGRIANEGFQDIEGQLGRTIRCNPLQYHQQLGPQHVTVLWKPGFRNTSVTYFNDRVPPQKKACNPRSNLLQATQGRGGPNSYDHGGNGYVITSDEAAKKYGGYLIKDFQATRNYDITNDQKAENYGGYLIKKRY